MIWIWIIANLIDLILTILIIQNGGFEVNPLMGFFINMNLVLFAFVKMAGASLACWFFIKHRNTLPIAVSVVLIAIGINGVSLCLGLVP